MVLAKQYLIEYIDITKLEFDNNNIDEIKVKMEKFPHNDIMHFLLKAIIIMKNNWAKSIDELNKLSNYVNKINIEDEIEKIKTESNTQYEKDLIEASVLSEKIKKDEI